MRSAFKYIFWVFSVVVFLAACTKVDRLPQYNKGTAVDLTASKTAVVASAADSTAEVVSFSWSNPKYATDSNTYKFLVQIDSAGRNFSNPFTTEVIGKLSTSLTGRELNTIVLNYGFSLGVPHSLDIRVISSYGNNNERYTSNTVKLNVTPYSDPSVLTTEHTSVTGTAATSVNHSNTFSWSASFPGYTGAITYALQYDSAGKNFAAPQEINAGNALSKSLNEDEMNSTALGSGIAIGSTGKVEYRVKATTASGAIAYSNAVTVTITTFSPVPANLYIVGDATPGGWSNPVPIPSQQFTKIDAYTFSITIGLTAGKSYLFLPVNGSWDHKYGGGTDGTQAGGGTLLKDGAVPGSNTPAPAVSGVYKIVVNFQTNKYTVTQIAVPDNLYIVGDATPGGWNNPVPIPSQQFTKIDNVSFGIVVNLTAGKSYLFLPVNGSWDHKYGGSTDGTNGGVLMADGAVPGSNTPAPSASGLYKIIVNFATNLYTVTPYEGPSDLYIVGDATAGGWNNPVPVPSQQFTKVNTAEFQLTLPLTSGKSYLLLPVNGNWDHKYGGSTDGTQAAGGALLADGDVPGSNTPAPAASGNYKIVVNFITMTYKVTPQ
jgi:starch-binding outer membrane protein SusE/F